MKVLTALLVLIALAMTPFGDAAAERTFRFNGGGWGHGVGMSQYGAYGLAQRGWGAARIVRHYYSGAATEQREPPAPTFRIGLLQRRAAVTLSAAAGGFELVLSSGQHVASVPAGESRRVAVRGGAYRVLKGQELVGGQAWGGSGDVLRVVRQPGAVVRVPEWGHPVGRGELQLTIVEPARAHLVAVLDPEEYLYGLGEVPSSWPDAVLQAQAIAARTYAHRRVMEHPAQNRSGCACGLYGSTLDQNYTGWDKEAGADGARWVAAVQATTKTVATFQGAPIATYYSSSSGGWTEDVDKVWGGPAQPYLRGKCDPGDYVDANPNRVWKSEIPGNEAAAKLRAKLGAAIATVTGLKVVSRGVSGRVVRAEVRGRASDGSPVAIPATGEQLRRALGLKSTRFWVNRDFNVRGEIRVRYDRMGCRPGLPSGPERTSPGGRWQAFAVGRLYFNALRGRVHWIHGPLLNTYLRKKAHRGRLGYPTSDVRRVKARRVRATFEGGSIACRPGARRCRVRFG